jgi:MipA family protein
MTPEGKRTSVVSSHHHRFASTPVPNPRHLAVALLMLGHLAAGTLHAEEKPLWEFGMGAGGLSFPDYRGSDRTQFYPVPVPYFVYRGKFLKADRDGLRGVFFDHRQVELNLSINATIPVDSDDSSARRGMPDLKPSVEIGPSLNVHLWRSADEHVKVDLVLPLRAPLTIESSPQSLGLLFEPRVGLSVQDLAGHDGLKFGIGAGLSYADEKFHEHYYSVAPRFATSTRAAYDADAGYSGAHVLTSVSRRFPRYWVGAYLRYDMLAGTTFEDSPLMQTNHSLAGGIAFAWMLRESSRRVTVEE